MSKNQKAKTVRIEIENPLVGSGHTSLAHAWRYIRRGAAEWVRPGRSIRMLEGVKCRERTITSAIVRRGEGLGMATLDQVEGLPVAGPAIRLFTGKPPKRPVYDPSTVEWMRQPCEQPPSRPPAQCQCRECRALRFAGMDVDLLAGEHGA